MANNELLIKTGDGEAKARLFRPSSMAANGAGVIFYMDAFGPRPALDEMAQRLADEGYAVLLPDLFYRAAPYCPFDAKTGFSDPVSGKQIRGLLTATTQKMTQADSEAFLDVLRAEGVTGPVGTVGYCMGGARALNAAAAYPGRIKAAASFHGGNLAGDAPDSPYHNAAQIEARVYVGCAGVDNSFPPEQAARLAEALRAAEVDYILENYAGMAHGWCVPDHSVYDEAGAERHWKRLLGFFAETLAA